MTTSGTYDWFLDNAGVITEAFGRCGIRPIALTREHFNSATRSLNLALQSWSNKGVNLFQIDLQSIPLIQGVAEYTLPSNTINILDAYLETYQLGTTVNQTPDFSTVTSSPVVTVGQDAHGLTTGQWIEIVTQIAVGGIVLYGFYQATVINGDEYSVTAATNATSTVNNGGAVPVFTTTLANTAVSVALTAHGYAANQQFPVQVATDIAGITLFGVYTIGSVTDANHFVITAPYEANAATSASENSGEVQLQTQASSADPIDNSMTSISRTDYASQPDKLSQGSPTTFWFDRQSPIPNVKLWDVPDGNGPYAFFYYRMRRVQDAYAASGETADIPYRFLDALCAEMAYRLSGKYAPALKASLKDDMDMAWGMATEEDRERVTVFIAPDTSGYYN